MSKSQFRKAFPWFLLSILVIIVDQASKYWITRRLQVEEVMPILPFFNFILRYNQGGAFNFLKESGAWHIVFLSAVSVIVIIALSVWLLRLRYPSAWTACALGLVIGGAAGNLIDRIRMSNVVDFLDFHLGNWHYATFNLADSAIVIGIIMLLLQGFFKK
jgi:signal peptidase II